MIRRRSDGHRCSTPVSVDELVSRLESGSGMAAEQLTGLVSTSPVVLDLVAASAARGSAPALELLLRLITAQRLAAPAISRITDDPAVAEDIEQDVLVAVNRSIESFRSEAKFTTWLYALARNAAVADRRRAKPTTDLGHDDLLDDGGGRRLSSQVAQRETIRQAIDSLPPPFRHPVLLRDIDGLSYAEIADRLDIEVNTVRSRLSRGRSMLAGRLS